MSNECVLHVINIRIDGRENIGVSIRCSEIVLEILI